MARVVHVPHKPCPNCQMTVAVSQALCPHCGCPTAAQTRPCPNCGTNVLASQLACPSCRFPLTNTRAASADPAIAQIIANAPAFQQTTSDLDIPVALPLRIALAVVAIVVGVGVFVMNVPGARSGAQHDFWVSVGPNASALVFLAVLFGAMLGYPSYTWIATARNWARYGFGWEMDIDFVGAGTAAASALVYILVGLAICRTAPAPAATAITVGKQALAATQHSDAWAAGFPLLIGYMACCGVCHLGNSVIAWKRYLW